MLEKLYKPLTPNQITNSMESPFSTNVLKNSIEKETNLPVLKSYVGPPQGSDGRLYRGLVDLGSPTEAQNKDKVE